MHCFAIGSFLRKKQMVIPCFVCFSNSAKNYNCDDKSWNNECTSQYIHQNILNHPINVSSYEWISTSAEEGFMNSIDLPPNFLILSSKKWFNL